MTTRLEDLKPGAVVRGLVAGETATIAQAEWHGTQVVTLTYRRPNGTVGSELIYRDHEARLTVDAGESRPWAFDADGADFRLAAEARRIQLAFESE